MLDPVFHAEQPVDMQIYVRLYPDIHGAPLDIQMEMLQRRTRRGSYGICLSKARSPTVRAKAPRAEPLVRRMYLGGQAKEFPYLANLKGAKFPPGDYQGIISIRQGKSVDQAVGRIQGDWQWPARRRR